MYTNNQLRQDAISSLTRQVKSLGTERGDISRIISPDSRMDALQIPQSEASSYWKASAEVSDLYFTLYTSLFANSNPRSTK